MQTKFGVRKHKTCTNSSLVVCIAMTGCKHNYKLQIHTNTNKPGSGKCVIDCNEGQLAEQMTRDKMTNMKRD